MRWIVRLFSALLMLALVALGLIMLVPSEKVAEVAAGEFSRLTGRKLTLEGAVRPTLWPHLGVTTGPVSIANADWSGEGPLLRAEGMEIRIDMATLFGGAVRVTGIALDAPVLLLETAADGRVNWDFSGAGGAGGGAAGEAMAFTLDRAVVSDGTVTWLDHAADRRGSVTEIALETAIPDFAGPVDLTAAARVNGQPVTLRARVGGLAAFLDGVVGPLDLTATAGDSALAFDGRLGISPFAAEGRLDAALSDLPALFAALGQSAPALPEGLGRRKIGVQGGLTLTPEGSVHLREGAVALDDNRLTGEADLVPGKDRPKLTAQVTTAALDLSELGGGSGGGGGTGWPSAPLDASGLGVLDAAVAFSADSVDLGAAQLGRTRLAVALDAARAVVDLREVAAYGGTVTGQVVVNARKGLSTRVDVTAAGMALQPLMTALAGYDRLIGTGDVTVNVLGTGGSVDAIMRSLEGEGRVALSQGELRGLDIAGMIRNMDPGFVGEGAKTIFDSIAATFTMTGGVLSNNDLAFRAPLLTASGAGQVDVGGQTLDYRVTPLSLGGSDLDADVQVPLLITGPWASPKFRLDLESLARRKLEEEAKKLEEKLKAELAKKAQEELGIEVQPGDDLEETARRAAEEFLKQELSKAQGNAQDPVQQDLQKQLQDQAGKALLDLLGGGN